MSKVIKTKHFQYNGVDDYNDHIDNQINTFCKKNSISKENIIDVKYSSNLGVDSNNYSYSALLIYEEED